MLAPDGDHRDFDVDAHAKLCVGAPTTDGAPRAMMGDRTLGVDEEGDALSELSDELPMEGYDEDWVR